MARTTHIAIALNFSADGVTAPEWIMLLPAGKLIEARDGRSWTNPDPGAVIAAFERSGVDLVIDYEHATEINPIDVNPAAGWIKALANRDGAIWGQVEWTDKAATMIAAREYRFISPVFLFDNGTKAIARLMSAALVHAPALTMPALASRQDRSTLSIGDEPMTDALRRALCSRLNLADEASDSAILAAIDTMSGDLDKALASVRTPPLEKFVPRADHDQVKADLDKASNRLATIETAEIEALVDGAIADLKIPTASRDYHLASARNDRAAFEGYIADAPKLAIAQDSGLDGKKPGGDDGKLDAADKAMCRSLGISEDDFIRTRDAA